MTAPTVGQTIITRAGEKAVIVKVYPFGTMDIKVLSTGDYFRVTGLDWIRKD